jgi:hypothetical protein
MGKVIVRETQADRILRVLGDGRWHTIADFGRDAYTGRNRIGEMRAAECGIRERGGVPEGGAVCGHGRCWRRS